MRFRIFHQENNTCSNSLGFLNMRRGIYSSGEINENSAELVAGCSICWSKFSPQEHCHAHVGLLHRMHRRCGRHLSHWIDYKLYFKAWCSENCGVLTSSSDRENASYKVITFSIQHGCRITIYSNSDFYSCRNMKSPDFIPVILDNCQRQNIPKDSKSLWIRSGCVLWL